MLSDAFHKFCQKQFLIVKPNLMRIFEILTILVKSIFAVPGIMNSLNPSGNKAHSFQRKSSNSYQNLLKMNQTGFTILVVFFWTFSIYLKAQPVLKFWGKERSKLLRTYTKLYLNQLELKEGFGLIVEETCKLPAGLDGLTLSDPIKHAEDFKYFRILLRSSLQEHELLLALAHEMIHLKQMMIDKLKIISSRKVRWKGKIYFIGENYNRSMPWEREAFHQDFPLYRFVKLLEDRHKSLAILEK